MKRLWSTFVRAGAWRERLLRKLRPARLHFVHYSWPLSPADCPCDVDFHAWLLERQVRNKSIFHFGTGGHHLVGLRNHEAGLENEILGLTLSPREHASYVARVIREPSLGRFYKVLFADIYTLHASSLPAFDIATLFHFCEFAPAATAGQNLTDAGLLQVFCARVKPDGLLLFYPGSYGYSKAASLIQRAVAEQRLVFVEQYKSIAVYRVTARGAV